MGLFSWLFGKRTGASPPPPDPQEAERKPTPSDPPQQISDRPKQARKPPHQPKGAEQPAIETGLSSDCFSRDELKAKVRSLDPNQTASCPVCRTAVKVRNLLRHFDDLHAAAFRKELPPQSESRAPSTGGHADSSSAIQSPTANVGVPLLDTLAVETLLKQPHGAALPMSVNDSGRVVTAFVFRESEDRIAELARSGAFASAHIKSSLLGVGDVQLYVTLVRFGDQVFEIWWNWHNPIIRPLFDRLFDQDEVVVGFVGDRPTIDNIHRYPSSIRNSLRANRSQLTAAQPWTMEAFDRARAAVEKEYPTPVALWQALGGGS